MENVEKRFASSLLDAGAVILRPENPFVWASGWHSPIYCDNRVILSIPSLRSEVVSWLSEKSKTLYPGAEVVAGVATGAIAIGVLTADRLSKPFVYVRPKPKDHGTLSQIEGRLPKGAKVLVIEDLVSTGTSSLAAVRALREAGAEVLGMVALFSYGFPAAKESFASEGVALDTLSNYDALIETALEKGLVKESDLEILSSWRKSPSTWTGE